MLAANLTEKKADVLTGNADIPLVELPVLFHG